MTISGTEMRDRLLARLAQPRPVETWVEVLASPGNRKLLGLIARERPQSIGALSDLAGRAQPNVSRSLTALVNSGLVETRIEGRRTVPVLTTLGLEKAREYGLLEAPTPSTLHVDQDRVIATIIKSSSTARKVESESVTGLFELSVWERSSRQPSAAILKSDLNALALRVVADWWRMLYRRDSLWRLGEATLQSAQLDRRIVVLIGSNGRDAELTLREEGGNAVPLARNGAEPIARFENALLDGFLHPVAAHLRLTGRVDRPLHSLLARLMESREDDQEAEFCRVAGALDLSPYDLPDSVSAEIRRVIETFIDEDARLDFASSLAVDELREQSEWLERQVNLHSDTNGFSVLDQLRKSCTPIGSGTPFVPWRLGRDCARLVRKALNLAPDHGVRGVAEVAKLFGADRFALSEMAPGALRGFQVTKDEEQVVLVEDEGSIATAFTLCRAIGDYVAHGSSTAVVADLYTQRQAVGRAFAAEFLAPGEGVVSMAEDEGQPTGRIARHYGVAPEVVHHQYANHSRAPQR